MEVNKKILVVDDEASIRRVIELKLKKRGYHVLTAGNGKEGLRIIKEQEPDIVVTDIMMPELDGKTLAEKTNELKEERPFLTIIMTCRISHDENNWMKRMKDTLFIEKPFSPSILLGYIEHYLGA